MKVLNPKTTLKVIVSYAAIVLLVGVFFFIFFEQLKILNGRNIETYDHTNTSFLLSNTLNDLLELEPLKQQYLDLPTSENFNKLKGKYKTINDKTKRLRQEDFSKDFQKDFDKIESLLTSKLKNLIALKKLYQRQTSSDYLGKVAEQLKQLDTLPNNVREVEKSKRTRLFRRIKPDKEESIQHKVAKIDSVVEDVSSRLKRLAIKEKRIKQRITAKEDELLQKDIILNRKIRGILYHLEKQAFSRYSEQLAQSKIQLKEAIWTVGLSSLFTLFAGGLFFLLIRRDLIRSTKNERTLMSANEKIKEALKSKENLIQMVSHDIRSPLQVILGNLEIVDNNAIHHESKNALGEMRYASTYILNLVTDLLYFFKGKSIQITYSNFNPYQLITSVVHQITPFENNKNLEIKLNIDPVLDTTFRSDPHRLQQILSNILSNAYKFTEKGSIFIHAEKKQKNDREQIEIRVTDTGVGIALDKKEHIFERFQRGDFESSYKDGFGLGLFITKFLMDELKGDFVIESEEGKGTSVRISIPLLKANYEQDFSLDTESVLATEDLLVYVVDDDISYLSFIETLLVKKKIRTCVFSSAKEALLSLKEEYPNVIITDLNMPKMDGIEFLQKIQEQLDGIDIPVIAFTGEVLLEEAYFKELGFAAKIAKPASALTIQKTLFQVLDKNIAIKAETTLVPTNFAIPNVFDLTKSLTMLEGDTEALEELLQIFVEDVEETIDQIESQMIKKNNIEVQQLAHRILPLFKQFEMVKCVEKLKDLEETNLAYSKKEVRKAMKLLRNDMLRLNTFRKSLLET